MVSIATEWFGFVPDDKMRAHVADGIQMIASESNKGGVVFNFVNVFLCLTLLSANHDCSRRQIL